jgi:molybdate transport system substrate-binding protein
MNPCRRLTSVQFEVRRLTHDFFTQKRYEQKSIHKDAQEPLSVQVLLVHLLCLSLLTSLSCATTVPDEKTITVFAASSLTEAFTQLKTGFEATYPDHRVELTFGGSQILRLQIENGASADVFSSADVEHIGALKTRGLVLNDQPFASNRLALIVPANNPAGIKNLEQLVRAHRIVLGSVHSPIGRYTDLFLTRLSEAWGPATVSTIRDRVVSREKNVRLVRAKVRLGVADAAIVYLSDTQHTDQIQSIDIPIRFNPRIQYVAARLSPKKSSQLWLEFLTTRPALEVLKQSGLEQVDTQ